MLSITGSRLKPTSVSAYSTRGGTSGYTVRVSSPDSSIERRLDVSTFWLTPPNARWSCPKRLVPLSNSRTISGLQRLPIRLNVVATGHAGKPLGNTAFGFSPRFFASSCIA